MILFLAYQIYSLTKFQKVQQVAATRLEPTVTWLSVRLQTEWFEVQVLLQSLKFHVLRLFRARSSLRFSRLQGAISL